MPTRPPLSTLGRLSIILTSLLSAHPAVARQASAAATREKIVDVSNTGGHPTMRDAKSGDVLLDYRGVPLFDTAGLKDAVEPAVQVQIQPDGFDIVYSFRNKGAAPAPMATLKLGVITLGTDAIYQDMRTAQTTLPAQPEHFPVRSLDYPDAMYSPVSVFRNSHYAVGVSIQYPILEYKHDLRITVKSPAGPLAKGAGGRGFEVDHALSAPAPEKPQALKTPVKPRPSGSTTPGGAPPRPVAEMPASSAQPGAGDANNAPKPTPRGPWPARPGLIDPGQERVYTVSVRVTRTPEEWVRTLVPYRDYFRRLYGGVTYKRHAGAVNGVVMANVGRIKADNPYGWVTEVPRPDKAGYKPWADEIKRRKGWSTFLIWQPTGLYDKVSEPTMEFPYQIATRWTADPKLVSALDSRSGLASIPSTGAGLGLWFNRCLEVTRQWNDRARTPLDPDDPALSAAAFAELDAATAAGVTVIGLDTFSTGIVPAWKLYPWLKTLRAKYPSVTFVTEPITFDIMHTLSPTFLRGYNDNTKPASLADLYKIRGPHVMADFLLPGHEIWGAVRYAGYRWFDAKVTPEVIENDAKRLASWGYRPLLFTDLDLPQPVEAAESWRSSIPADLRLPDDSAKK